MKNGLLFCAVLASHILCMHFASSYRLTPHYNQLISKLKFNVRDSQKSASNTAPSTVIALTRERNSNDEVRAMLEARLKEMGPIAARIVNVPCISFEEGPDASLLAPNLLAADGILLTSPRVSDVELQCST